MTPQERDRDWPYLHQNLSPGSFVAEARRALALSRDELADLLLNHSRETVRRWEDGTRAPHPLVLAVLLVFLTQGRPKGWPSDILKKPPRRSLGK